jgi:hypothetical protein
MKKQSRGHPEDRQDVQTVTPFPGNSRTGSRPKGVHAGEIAKPTQLDKGAAESRTEPVELHGRTNRSTTSVSHTTPPVSRNRPH